MRNFVNELIHDVNIRQMILTKSPDAIYALDCHHDVINAFHRVCVNLGEVSGLFFNGLNCRSLDSERLCPYARQNTRQLV